MKAAEIALADLVKAYQPTAPKLADWLEKNMPEGLTVFTLTENHRRRMRTSNPMERAVQQEIKRRTQKVRVFPNEASLIRLVSAVLVEIDDNWVAETKAYIKWGMPGCVSTQTQNFQTSGCAIASFRCGCHFGSVDTSKFQLHGLAC